MKKIVFVGQITSKEPMANILLIDMEQSDLRDMYHICGGDFSEKMCLLTEFIDCQGISVG